MLLHINSDKVQNLRKEKQLSKAYAIEGNEVYDDLSWVVICHVK